MRNTNDITLGGDKGSVPSPPTTDIVNLTEDVQFPTYEQKQGGLGTKDAQFLIYEQKQGMPNFGDVFISLSCSVFLILS